MSRVLALCLVFLYSLFALSGMASPGPNVAQAEQSPAFVCTYLQVPKYGFTGLAVNFTDQLQIEVTVNVYFVWFNSANQVVSIGWQDNVTFAPGQNLGFFNTYTSPGVFTVNTFVQDQVGNALSLDCAAYVAIP